MAISNKINRSQLRDYFKKNAIPTEGHFKQLIDSQLNQADDSIAKIDGQPVGLQPDTADAGNKNVLNLYKSFEQDKPSWILSLTPLSDPQDLNSAKPGLSFGGTDGGASKLFISESTDGNVGIGTTGPTQKLEVKGNAIIGDSGHELYIGDAGGHTNYAGIAHKTIAANPGDYALIQHSEGTTILNSKSGKHLHFRQGNSDKMIIKDGNVGIGTTGPAAKLDIADVIRSGTHPTTIKGLYVTGDFGPSSNGVEFRHTNGTQGIGFGYNTIYATGSNSNQNLNLNPKGTGKVGIGTTNPKTTLQVKGNGHQLFSVSRKDNDTPALYLGNDDTTNNHAVIASNNADLRLGRDLSGTFTERVRITNAGNVGIGTTSPDQKLHVNGKAKVTNGITVEGARSYFKDSEKSDGTGLRVGAAWGMYGIYAQNGACVVGGVDGVRIQHDRVTVKTNGNVGIGTTSPDQKLHVNGNAQIGESGEELKIGNVGHGNCAGIAHKNRANGTDYALIQNSNGNTYLNSMSGRHLHFRQGNTDKMIIKDGKVGIGTTSPKEALHVNGDIYAKGHVYLHAYEGDGSSGIAYLQARDSSTTSNVSLQLRTKQGSSIRDVMRLTHDRKVGIGTTNPKAPLHVASRSGRIGGSNFRRNAGHTEYWSIGCHEWVGAQGFRNWSDARVKTDPIPLDPHNSLKKINQLKLVDYKHVPEYMGGAKGRGVYAQEAQEIFPEAISIFEEMALDNGEILKDFHSVDYDWLFVTGLSAIQELSKRITELKNQIKLLEKKMV